MSGVLRALQRFWDRAGIRCPFCGRWRFDGRLNRPFEMRAQHNTIVLDLGLDPALDFALGDTVQHLGVRGRRFGAKIAILGRQITKILGNRLHGGERLVEPFQGA